MRPMRSAAARSRRLGLRHPRSLAHLGSLRPSAAVIPAACPRSTPPSLPSPWRPLLPAAASPLPTSRFRFFSATPLPRARARHDEDSDLTPTIYALSTAPGRAAIAVVRISGPACLQIHAALCPSQPAPKPRTAALRALHHPHTSAPLDPGALVLYFPGPSSVTGEDVLELHLHGSPAIQAAVLAAIPLCSSPPPPSSSASPPPSLPRRRLPIRPADAGEFTRRAFQNHRLSLPEVEALGETLSASTSQQLRLSLLGSSPALTRRYERWRELLLSARGELEALLDFSEDQAFDAPTSQLLHNVRAEVTQLRASISHFLQTAERGELLRSGIRLVFVGAPNAGKSSLLNCVVGREAAIVSEEPGTTRDVVETVIDVGGFAVRMADTAGLRGVDLAGGVEREGMRRARERVREAQVVVGVVEVGEGGRVSVDEEVAAVLREAVEAGKRVLVVANKVDLLPSVPSSPPSSSTENVRRQVLDALDGLGAEDVFPISCRAAISDTPLSTDADEDPGGIHHFLTHGLLSSFTQLTSATSASSSAPQQEDDDSLAATTRQRTLVQQCLSHLETFESLCLAGAGENHHTGWAGAEEGVDADADVDVVVAAEELRAAADMLARVVGKGEAGDVESVLGVVFERFCVGK